jgi:hypothetical protein
MQEGRGGEKERVCEREIERERESKRDKRIQNVRMQNSCRKGREEKKKKERKSE